MPKNTHSYQADPAPLKAITPSGIIAWEEGCLKCAVCVKSDAFKGL